MGLWACPAQRGVARRWLLGFVAAVSLTLASKVAFMGWGIGSADWDFTGFSGHAMSAASVLPLLAWLGLQACASARWRAAGLLLAYGLAAGIAYSRLPVGAHSPSEALLGFLLGAGASLFALAAPFGEALSASLRSLLPAGSAGSAGAARLGEGADAAPARALRRGAMLAILMAGVLSAAPWISPPTRSHQWVTALSLKLSGRPAPFTRHQLHRRAAEALALAQAR
ncbi:hypothetical protein CDN99_23090 [Roseateles aquatilis]|uniref:Phosphatidic acid phosphatase type 2/haloperoxidase domain-containing protein n=2 Tax=Roseateles aquatilis TaxID=431061 RepID=A0A246IYA2_9BURK|nr:hypothetical protein CDN99_23090 [Roseateles aquatilis]